MRDKDGGKGEEKKEREGRRVRQRREERGKNGEVRGEKVRKGEEK